MENSNHKPVTLDDLAVMVGDGFNDLGQRMDKFEGRMDKLDARMDNLGGRMDTLEKRMTALNSSVNNYLDLSDKRYLELKRSISFLANWLKVVGDRTGVPIDLSQLEKF